MQGRPEGTVLITFNSRSTNTYLVLEKRVRTNPLALHDNVYAEEPVDDQEKLKNIAYVTTRIIVNNAAITNNVRLFEGHDSAEEVELYINEGRYTFVSNHPPEVINWTVEKVMKGAFSGNKV